MIKQCCSSNQCSFGASLAHFKSYVVLMKEPCFQVCELDLLKKSTRIGKLLYQFMTTRCDSHKQIIQRFTQALPEYLVHYPCFVLRILTFSVGFKTELRQLIGYILKKYHLLLELCYNALSCIDMTGPCIDMTAIKYR